MSQLSVFDLDQTLITGNSSYLFGSFLYKNHQIPFFTMLQLVAYYALYKAKMLSILGMQQKIFHTYFYGRNQLVTEKFAEQFISENFEKLLNLPAIDRLLIAQKQGHYIALFSSGPSFLVNIFARRFKVDFWDSTHYDSGNNQFSEISKYMLGDDKARYTLELAEKLKIDHSEVTAYSDSIDDLPLLLAAGKAVGVNPDRLLLKLCRQNNWEVI